MTLVCLVLGTGTLGLAAVVPDFGTAMAILGTDERAVGQGRSDKTMHRPAPDTEGDGRQDRRRTVAWLSFRDPRGSPPSG
jgi:hypothetical protein